MKALSDSCPARDHFGKRRQRGGADSRHRGRCSTGVGACRPRRRSAAGRDAWCSGRDAWRCGGSSSTGRSCGPRRGRTTPRPLSHHGDCRHRAGKLPLRVRLLLTSNISALLSVPPYRL